MATFLLLFQRSTLRPRKVVREVSFFCIPPPTVAGRLVFNNTLPLDSGGQCEILTAPTHMAQTTHGLLLAESTSIEYVPRLSPPMPRNVSDSSNSSIQDSSSNDFPQGEATTEGPNPTSLPSFYPSGSRDATPSSVPGQSPRNWWNSIFYGWRVVLLSCTPFLYNSFLSPSHQSFKGSMYFWCSYHYPCVLRAFL